MGYRPEIDALEKTIEGLREFCIHLEKSLRDTPQHSYSAEVLLDAAKTFDTILSDLRSSGIVE